MSRPCPCGRVRPGEPFDPQLDCGLCWHALHTEACRRNWGLVGPAVPVRGGPPAAAVAAPPCAHRGRPTGEVEECTSCSGRLAAVPVLGCRRHGECHAGPQYLTGVRACQRCPDAATWLVPGLVDPLPGAWRPPGDWCEDPAEAGRHGAALAGLAAAELPGPASAEGDGLVTCGGGRYWPGVVVLVRMLRELGSTLPVQVWHRGTVEPVDPADVAGLGVELVDADRLAGERADGRVPRGRSHVGGWEAKLYALAHCPFRRVVFLDADAYLSADPAPLLEAAERHGFAAWSEPGLDNVNWPKVMFAGRPQDAPPSIQGGQLGIDRVRCWRELVLAHWVCQHSDYYWPAGRSGWPLFGDQDAWRLAFTHTGFRPHVLGPAEHRPGWGYVLRHAGAVLVEHLCFSKLIPAGTPGEGRALAHYAEYLGRRAGVS